MSEHSRAEKKAWVEFSKMIRARDNIGGNFRCPTCGRTLPIEEADAGHYITRARKSVMFDEMNVHAQCRHCNRFEEGNHFLYRRWLVDKYEEKKVEELERRAHISGGYTTVDLLLMAKDYRARTKAIIERKEKLQNLLEGFKK
ncbi:MAG: recombination protein NinG [Treponema sp.]|jgi:DNA-directed RNA polymerase subunit M/transcription elongation factor TFIIS|nr:recombination protein NinG [Treponema sp.]